MNFPQERLLQLLRSPRSLEQLDHRGASLCSEDGKESYPIVGGIPVLIDDDASVFAIEDFSERPSEIEAKASLGRRLAEHLVPSVSKNLAARDNYRRMAAALAERGGNPRVLVVGGSVLGEGFEELLAVPRIELIESDVSFGPRTDLICDGHSLPFPDETFDAVVCQAVLEHVADPPRVVDEVWRVLLADGLVYSEIPFMQQVHEGAYDFTRYTLVGHRRLYRRFEALSLGAVGGPGMTLAWSVVYFARSLGGGSAVTGDLLAAAARILTFWLKHVDHLLLRFPAAVDGASGTYFLGRKTDAVLSDRALVREMGAAEGGYLMWRH